LQPKRFYGRRILENQDFRSQSPKKVVILPVEEGDQYKEEV